MIALADIYTTEPEDALRAKDVSVCVCVCDQVQWLRLHVQTPKG